MGLFKIWHLKSPYFNMKIDRQSCRQSINCFKNFLMACCLQEVFGLINEITRPRYIEWKSGIWPNQSKKTTARNHELERWPDNRQTVDDTAKGTYSDFGRHKLKTVSNLRKNLQTISQDTSQEPFILHFEISSALVSGWALELATFRSNF